MLNHALFPDFTAPDVTLRCHLSIRVLLLCGIVGVAGGLLAAPVSADEPSSCGSDGGFALDATTVGAYEAAQFSAWVLVGTPYCPVLELRAVSVDDGVVSLDLRLGEFSGPGACPGPFLEGELPALPPGDYTVRAVQSFGDSGSEQPCLLGEESLTVESSQSASMLDNSEFDRNLDGWSTTGTWAWEGDAVRAETLAQLAQCVPVSALEQYRVVATARGVGSPATLGLRAVYSQGACPAATVATGETIVEVGSEDLERVELLLSPPSGTTDPASSSQLYARITATNEGGGATLWLDSVRLERLGCGEGGDTVGCAHGGRFEIRLVWEDFSGASGPGRLVTAAKDSSLWWFFQDRNWEMLVKVLRGCALGGHWWVFAAGATNVAWNLTVDDTSTGTSWNYRNPLGLRSPAITDTAALACGESE